MIQPREGVRAKPLHGIRIADFTVHAAGPFCTHMLSQLGAECIKIESRLRPDIFRKPHPLYGRMGPASFDQVASNKLSIRLNLKHEKGVGLARRLVEVSDVVVENFRPGVMDRLGLGWRNLSQVKPDLVMVSVSSSGQTGPESSFAGYAPLFGAWGGLGTLSGYADGPPLEMRHVMDHSAGLNGALGVLAGLHQRRKTGGGVYVDVAAREVACAAIGDALLQAAVGLEPARLGNAHEGMAPHGVYPAAGDDRWITIAVRDDAQWKRFAEIADGSGLADDARFATAALRVRHRDALDPIVAAWTRGRDAAATAARLQQAGIAAHVSWGPQDLVADEHLRARGEIFDVPGAGGAPRPSIKVPIRFSQLDAGADRPVPGLGEHEEYVFGELLGLDPASRQDLERDGAIQ